MKKTFERILVFCRSYVLRIYFVTLTTLTGHFIFKIGDSTSIILQLAIHFNVNATLLLHSVILEYFNIKKKHFLILKVEIFLN